MILQDGTDTKGHRTFANFSKFVRPGYARVEVAGATPTGALLSAYKDDGASLVVVAINKSTAAIELPIAITGGAAPTSMTAWRTSHPVPTPVHVDSREHPARPLRRHDRWIQLTPDAR